MCVHCLLRYTASHIAKVFGVRAVVQQTCWDIVYNVEVGGFRCGTLLALCRYHAGTLLYPLVEVLMF